MKCPQCKTDGWKVLPLTVGAHVREEYWGKVGEDFFFCPNFDCDVIYFNKETVFTKEHVKTRVKAKENPKPVCYCNRVTEETLIEYAERYGKEKALEITKAGRGKWCVVTNPSGRCCEWYLRKLGFALKGEERKKKVKLELSGLTCMGCVSEVKAALENAGAKVIKIDLESAEIEGEDLDKFIKAVKEAGYSARVKEKM